MSGAGRGGIRRNKNYMGARTSVCDRLHMKCLNLIKLNMTSWCCLLQTRPIHIVSSISTKSCIYSDSDNQHAEKGVFYWLYALEYLHCGNTCKFCVTSG
jgi:hypothetical protein